MTSEAYATMCLLVKEAKPGCYPQLGKLAFRLPVMDVMTRNYDELVP